MSKNSMETNPGPKILVVDDSPTNREFLCMELEDAGYHVSAAENGTKALNQIQSQQFDLIVLDVILPDLNGFELIPLIREHNEITALPIIMATSRTESEDIVRALELGANDYVVKPIDIPVLLSRIKLQIGLTQLTQLKDDFLRIASHDLKNPLSVILGFANLGQNILTNSKDNLTADDIEQLTSGLNTILTQGKVMQRIITDFLDFQAARDGQLKLRLLPFDLSTLIQDIIAENREYASSKSNRLHIELESERRLVNADAARIRQVLQNLISNAIKFSPKGSRTSVETCVDGDHILVEIRDTGPGLSEGDLKQIFQKYATLSNKPTGDEISTGLGLAITKQLVEAHGGRIGVRNNATKGATFWFTVPMM